MSDSRHEIPLPTSFLPADLKSLAPVELTRRGRATVALIERSHFELGRLLAHVYDNPRRFGYASAIDYAEAELGVREREAYHLLELERATRELPALRDAYANGHASFSNVREVVKVATREDDARWAEIATTLPFRAVYAKVHGEGSARAERGEAPWPDTGLHGEMGRPEPVRQEERPLTPALRTLEREVWELHNRLAGRDTGWRDLYEAMLVSYRHDLERLVAEMVDGDTRAVLERDGWRCRVPNCSRRADLQRHHVVHRSQGGSDDARNLITLCPSHHEAHHLGRLAIRGDAERGFTFRHRAASDEAWQAYPPGHAYDPLERAWDGPSYVREAAAHVFNTRVTRAATSGNVDHARASPS